jgi:hypothetical protein
VNISTIATPIPTALGRYALIRAGPDRAGGTGVAGPELVLPAWERAERAIEILSPRATCRPIAAVTICRIVACFGAGRKPASTTTATVIFRICPAVPGGPHP